MDETAEPRRPIRRPLLLLCALVLIAGVIGAASRHGSRDATATARATASSSPATSADAANATGFKLLGAPVSTVAAPEGAAATSGAGSGASAGATAPAVVVAPATAAATGGTGALASTVAPPPADSARIVKTGSIELGIGKGTLEQTMTSITTTVSGMGGYVSSSQNNGIGSDDNARPSGQLVVRVPAASFDDLVNQVRKLGDVRSVTTSGQDVTAQFTDLDARINALTATRDQLLTILGQASAIQDVLQVQDRITQVQSDLDSLTGQRKLLDDQATYGTLTINALEPGAEIAPAPKPSNDRDLGDAWRTAKERFVDGIADVIEGSGTVALLALFALAGWVVYSLVRRRWRPVSSAPATPR